MKSLLFVLAILPSTYSYRSAPERILGDGYPLEIYEVQTRDGYFLTIHRIPHSFKIKESFHRQPAVFIHGLTCSTDTYLVGGSASSIIYRTVDAGFDVWIPNLRGNKYSKKHANLSTSDSKFWSFNFQEMAVYDLPAVVDFVLRKTGHKEIHCIGFSMGTTILYIWLSERPEYNQVVKSGQMIAPVAYIGNCHCPLARLMTYLYGFMLPFENTEIAPFNYIFAEIKGKVCNDDSPVKEFCKLMIDSVFGVDNVNLNRSLIKDYYTATPSGTSMNVVIHFIQLIISGHFRKYDFGPSFNMEKYGQPTPPDYRLGRITAPVYIYYAGEGDFFSSKADVLETVKQLSNVRFAKNIEDVQWSHLDFMIAKNVHKEVNDVLIGFMKKGV